MKNNSDPIFALDSYAKLNLYLEVLNKRKDNYHDITTLFERISLCDKIILKSRRDKKINLVCRPHLRGVPEGPANLAYRAAKLLQDTFKIDNGADIEIIKRIPAGSGMGGGSSNAATMLTGLNKLWKRNLTRDKLARLAEELGCDVPFFIYDTPFALGEERGDKITPLKRLAKVRLWHIVVLPKIGVSTPSIYEKWDEKKEAMKGERAGLTIPAPDVKMLIQALRERNFSLIAKNLFNSLERVTVKLYPEVARVKERLLALGPEPVLMSGSGPAVFAVASSRSDALSISRQLLDFKGWRVFVARTR